MSTTARDFPDWLGPMLVKELRQGLKARAFVVTFIALQTLFVIVVAFSALLYARDPDKFQAGTLNGIFWALVGLHLLAITPLRALNSLAGERKANTLELIFMTGLTSWRIAVGKWASLLFQAALFVLAVLPYGIVRYYFGGVNLTEDLLALGMMLLASALFTAAALAISGLPIFFRIITLCGAVLLITGVVPGIFVGLLMHSFGGGSTSFFHTFSPGPNEPWIAGLFGAALLTVGFLEMAAASIAPVAENHALRQRLIALAAWVPVPVMMALGLDQEWIGAGTAFFAAVAIVVTFQHLAVAPMPLRTHVEPFAKAGAPGTFIGAFFQPGWPGAALFLILAIALVISTGMWAVPDTSGRVEFATFILLGAAAMLTPPVLWNLLPYKPRLPVVSHFLVLLAGGGAAIFLNLLDTRNQWRLGDYPVLGIFPPLGFWARIDLRHSSPELWSWLLVAGTMLAVCFFGLMLQSLRYWRRVWAHHRDIRATQRVPLPAPALP